MPHFPPRNSRLFMFPTRYIHNLLWEVVAERKEGGREGVREGEGGRERGIEGVREGGRERERGIEGVREGGRERERDRGSEGGRKGNTYQ